MRRAGKLPRPTPAELAILAVLWERGAATVREVHEQLASDGGYTTTLKLMQIMTDKGLLVRDEKQRAHVYRAAVARADVQSRMLDELVDRAFAGSAAQLVQRVLSRRRASAEELAEIRSMLDDYEGKRS
jgi:predicted transcriptional regulator